MKFLKETYLKDPSAGSRRLSALFERQGEIVNRKRLQRLRREMGMRAIYCQPRTSISNKAHQKYPYLLRKLKITYSNQVWCTDITYVPMPRGHVYLCCILDWYSRKVLGWEISNTMDALLCQKALLAAIKHSKALPKILNTDQGSQFTSTEWINELSKHGITISMDGKGRWRDNIYIERFWRSVKYECIFLKEYSTLPALENGLQAWIKRYNTWRPHQALDNKTPQQFYQEGLRKVGSQEQVTVLTSSCTPSAPKVLDAPLQVLEVTSLRSENLSNLPLHIQNLALTSSSPSS
jgi:putative transposase